MKRVFAIATTIICLILIINLSRELLRLSQSDKRLKEAEDNVKQLKLENWKLTQEKQYRQSDSFLENEIRNKLLLGKEGETIVILPKDEVDAIASASSEETQKEKKAPWQQWLALFR